VFAFNVHPAYVALGDGIGVAWGYLGATWRSWLPLIVAVGLADLLIGLMTNSIMPTDSTKWFTEDPVTGRLVASAEFNAALGRIVAAGLLRGLIGLVAGWFVTGIAIAGLRGRPLELGWILGRGVTAFLTSILVGLAIVSVVVIWLVAILISAVFPPLLLVTIPGGCVFLVWVVVRLIFTTLAVFDGRGVFDALAESWDLSNRSVMRLLGWGFVAWLIGIAFWIATGFVTAAFSAGGAAAVASGLSSAASQVAACFSTFMLAVLYESQGLRRDIMTGAEPMPAGPYGPGPAPGPYPGGTYLAGWNPGGPANPGTGYTPSRGYPGWVDPQSRDPGAYPPAQFPSDRQQGWGNPGNPAVDPAPTWQGYPPSPIAAADPQATVDSASPADPTATLAPPAAADPVAPVWKWPEPPGAKGDDTPRSTGGTTDG
jgi:hypothetical protein